MGEGTLLKKGFPRPSPAPPPATPNTLVFFVGEAESVFRMMTL